MDLKQLGIIINKKNMKKYYIVFNENKTQGIIVDESQLAYEARKGSDSNCFTENGEKSLIAVAFCEQTISESCTLIEITLDNNLKYSEEDIINFYKKYKKYCFDKESPFCDNITLPFKEWFQTIKLIK